MKFTIDDAHATLGRITHIGTALEAVNMKAKSLFEPQVPTMPKDGQSVEVRS